MKAFMFAAAAVALIAAGLLFATRDQRRTETVAVATRKLAPYTILVAADLKLEQRHIGVGNTDVASATPPLVGQMALSPIGKGAVVKPSQILSAGPLANRVLVTVTSTSTPTFASDAPGPGGLADVILSPRLPAAKGAVLEGAMVVAVTKEKAATTYTLAVSRADRATIANLLGYSDVRVTPLTPSG